MSFQERDNSGALFRNERKTEGSKQPDYNGTATVNGKKMKISAWVKESKAGKKYFSFSFQPDERPAQDSGDHGDGWS